MTLAELKRNANTGKKRHLSNGKVLDNQVKGEAILKYKVYMYVE